MGIRIMRGLRPLAAATAETQSPISAPGVTFFGSRPIEQLQSQSRSRSRRSARVPAAQLQSRRLRCRHIPIRAEQSGAEWGHASPPRHSRVGETQRRGPQRGCGVGDTQRGGPQRGCGVGDSDVGISPFGRSKAEPSGVMRHHHVIRGSEIRACSHSGMDYGRGCCALPDSGF